MSVHLGCKNFIVFKHFQHQITIKCPWFSQLLLVDCRDYLAAHCLNSSWSRVKLATCLCIYTHLNWYYPTTSTPAEIWLCLHNYQSSSVEVSNCSNSGRSGIPSKQQTYTEVCVMTETLLSFFCLPFCDCFRVPFQIFLLLSCIAGRDLYI